MTTEPTEAELFAEAFKSFLSQVHTSIPALVQSYDSETQSANVRIAVKRTVLKEEGGWSHREYPIIPNVKLMWLGAGGCSIQFPVNVGDSVYLLFSESCWSQFRRTGEVSEPGDQRRFDLSYPIAVPTQLVQSLRAVSNPHIEIPDGQFLTVGADPAATDFVALSAKVMTEMNKIRTALNGHTHTVTGTCGGAGSALTAGQALAPSNMGALSSVAATKLKAE